MAERPSERVPLTSVAGFLGAGKTTLVNHILREAAGARIVVFVNDFGAINIDHDLIETIETDRISLKNGCVCCSLNGDLIAGVTGFVRGKNSPDAIVIEASGIADPRALDSSLEALEAAGLIRLDARLYVLDAATFQSLGYDDQETIIDHTAVSDIVLLNKVDLVSAETRQDLTKLLADAAPFAQVVETVGCHVPLDVISEPAGRSQKRPRAIAGDLSANIADHSKNYASWSYQLDGVLDRQRFEDFAGNLAGRYLRAKGILRFQDAPDRSYSFNLVGYRATLEATKNGAASGPCRIVVIGGVDSMDSRELLRAFSEALCGAPGESGTGSGSFIPQ